MAEINGAANLSTKNGNFICGVVEGFYGRPWTTEQRKDLFQKLKKWGMDSYLYAPKDDYKHRAYWRDLYTVEEAEHLTGLITAARECGITFYYALSPGLDITYSSTKEVTALKRKLEQVSQFGCTAFALLFDDIEPEMSEADKEVFQSFAHAQVSVTNDIFQHLGQPRFLLCPTQYCATRAMPNVASSEYLNTLGSKLAQEIDIMWTGPKVISRLLTVESIEEITEVLRRPPVIWDNLHANDYDQKRVFLGPYSGRSPDLIPKLRGVLTNPNCEYGANFIAIHTLAQWSRCNVDGKRDLSLNDTVTADIKLETETEDGVLGEDVPSTLSPNMYHPRHALKNAISDWLIEFSKKRAAWGVIAKPQPCVAPTIPIPIIPSVNTCMSLTSTTTTTVPATPAPVTNANHLQALAEVCSTVTTADSFAQPPSGPVLNSLVSETKVVTEPIIPSICSIVENEAAPTTLSSMEPMDCNTTPNNSPAHAPKIPTEDEAMVENASTCSEASGSMQVEVDGTSPTVNGTQMIVEHDHENHQNAGNVQIEPLDPKEVDKQLTHEDLALLCDLFYLPFEHGGQGIQLLQEFNWLKSNAHVVMRKSKEESTVSESDIEEWHTRAAKLNDMCNAVNRLFQRLTYCNNRELLYDLYSYVWDMRGVVSLLNSYVKWLEQKYPQYCVWQIPSVDDNVYPGELHMYAIHQSLSNSPQMRAINKASNFNTLFEVLQRQSISPIMSKILARRMRFSNGWKETFMSGDQEPWVFRGGLTADLQRLIPVDSGNDLFVYKAPEVPSSKIYTIRPYLPSDEAAVYAVCNQIALCTSSTAVADRVVGGFLTLSPELCMVVEDENEIVGYALAALNVKTFNEKMSVSWIPELRMKYPLDNITELPQDAQDAINYFHSFVPDVSEHLCRQHPSKVLCAVSPTVADQSVPKRLITCVLAALRANGSFGVHTTMPSSDKEAHEFYGKLGFLDLNPAHEEHPGIKTMCRSF